MKNFKTLYHFELKKIFSRKIVWITIAIILILNASTVYSQILGTYYIGEKKVGSNYSIFIQSKNNEKALSGRLIDQQLLDETWAAYGRIPVQSQQYTGTEEYWKYAYPYSAVFNFVREYMGVSVEDALNWKANESSLYGGRQDVLESIWNNYYLTKGEKDYWSQKELSVEKPLKYAYKEGWWTLLDALYTIGIMTLLTIAVCISNVFTVEQSRKTDQLIFCSCYGKSTLYMAKLSAGISFAAFVALFYTIVVGLQTLLLYGWDGFSAAFQLIYPDYSAPISVGQAALAAYGLLIMAAVLTGVFTMILSEILKNGVGTLAVLSGIIILSMFVSIPNHFRVLAQIWNYIPSVFLAIWNIFDCRLVPFMGTYLTNIQFVPILYIVISILLSVLGYQIYRRNQVETR